MLLIVIVGGYNVYNSTFEAVEGGGPILSPSTNNLVDIVWEEDTQNQRPTYPERPLIVIDAAKYTGIQMIL